MGRGAYALARVAVMVRTAGRWCWWLGALAALAGAFVPGLTGRRIGALGGAALFLLAAVAAFLARRRRYAALAQAATHAAKSAFLQDRRVTARLWLRPRRWWLLLAFVLAVGSSAAASAAGGMLLAGVGAGLWAKAVWLGRWERSHEALLWTCPEEALRRGPAGGDVRAYLTTGPAAGDARPGGARRVVSPAR
ncbi:hypothetical protein [Streptomyces sp. RPT161]|uniref:hypothetical protein n=1 Tax=Streptomyces sp. RPT161 TaxID=3015993 RepID=UPI0022B86769|nr:hypothetical protein [Streptomyces sp. RPT161]